MKKLLAIFFVLALALIQPAVANLGDCATAAKCCDCGGKMKCCVSKSTQPDREAPAATSPNVSQKDFQTILPLLLRVTTPIIPAPQNVFSTDRSTLVSSAIPIFARDCAFLI